MKKSLLALAALSAVAGAASAQVTLSGSVDLGVASVDGKKVMQTAGTSGRSNLTFSGKEDLGNGMSAYFVLNHRFNPNDGTNNPGGNNKTDTQFYRNSFVGLDTKAGGVRLGRYLSPLQELNGNYDAFGTDTVGSVHTGGLKGNVRVNSGLEYRSPVFSGLQVLLMSAEFDKQGATNPTRRAGGASISFNQGPVSLALATDRTAGGTVGTGATALVGELSTNGVYGSFALPNSAKVMFQYEKGDVSTAAAPSATSKALSISTKVPVGAVDLKAGFRKITADNAQDKKKFGLGADYNLSKRTQLYVDMGKQSGNGYTTAQQKTQWDIGMYHKF